MRWTTGGGSSSRSRGVNTRRLLLHGLCQFGDYRASTSRSVAYVIGRGTTHSPKFPSPGIFCPDFDPNSCCRHRASKLVAKQCGRHSRPTSLFPCLPCGVRANLNSGGLLVRNLTAGRTMRASTAIRRDQFRRPASRAKTKAQLAGESRLRHAQVAFCFIEKISNIHSRVSVGRKIFARGPKLVGYQTNRKQR